MLPSEVSPVQISSLVRSCRKQKNGNRQFDLRFLHRNLVGSSTAHQSAILDIHFEMSTAGSTLSLSTFLFVTFLSLNSPCTSGSKIPVIGVFTHPYYGPGLHPGRASDKGAAKLAGSMIGASYVKLLQAGGAQVVPIFYDSTSEELREVGTFVSGQ